MEYFCQRKLISKIIKLAVAAVPRKACQIPTIVDRAARDPLNTTTIYFMSSTVCIIISNLVRINLHRREMSMIAKQWTC